MTVPEQVLDVGALEVKRGRVAGPLGDLLTDVTLSVAKREIVGVVGISGSGKSLLAAAILGVLDASHVQVTGSVKVNGIEMVGEPESALRKRRGSEIGFIVSNARARLNPLMSVGEQLVIAMREKRALSKTQAFAEARALLEAVGIGDPDRRMKALPSELSGGMCQRVVIAIGICNEPSLIIADEPTSGLDVTIQTQVLTLIREITTRRDAGMLLMTRDLGVVAHFCDRVIVLQAGRIVEASGIREFFANPQHEHSSFLLRAAFAARAEDSEDSSQTPSVGTTGEAS